MKKIISLSMAIFLFISILGINVYADDCVKKLGRGLANVLTCPLEVPREMENTNSENGIFAAFTWGLVKGIVKMAVRLGVGVYEVVSFPVPFPADYAPIITDPEFITE